MARFLHTVWPVPGHLHPNIAVAQALASNGHEVAFYTGASVKSLVNEQGFRAFPFSSVDEERVRSIVMDIGGRSLWDRPRELRAMAQEWLVGTISGQLRDLETVVQEWLPDVFVCDPTMWGPLLVLSELRELPAAVLSCVAACVLPGRDGPITGVPLRRPRTLRARVVRGVLRKLAGQVGGSIPRAASSVRREYGLPPLQTNVTEFIGKAPLYLVPSTPAFDYQRTDLPRSVQYVGPCLWDRPRHQNPPAWLAELRTDRPVVYVTEGSLYARRPVLLEAAARGLAGSNFEVVMTTGTHRAPHDLGLAPSAPGMRVEQWIPHSDLFPHTDVVVTTGGSGTVLEALRAGLPLVVVPKAWDQPENAWRVEDAGAGIRLSGGECTPDRLRNAVQRVHSDPSFRAHARRLAADFAASGGPARAAELLEQLVKAPVPV